MSGLPSNRFNILFSSLTNLKEKHDLGEILSERNKERISKLPLCCNREEARAGFWQNAVNEERRAGTEGEQPFAMCHHLPGGKKSIPCMENVMPWVYLTFKQAAALLNAPRVLAFFGGDQDKLFYRRTYSFNWGPKKSLLLLLFQDSREGKINACNVCLWCSKRKCLLPNIPFEKQTITKPTKKRAKKHKKPKKNSTQKEGKKAQKKAKKKSTNQFCLEKVSNYLKPTSSFYDKSKLALLTYHFHGC